MCDLIRIAHPQMARCKDHFSLVMQTPYRSRAIIMSQKSSCDVGLRRRNKRFEMPAIWTLAAVWPAMRLRSMPKLPAIRVQRRKPLRSGKTKPHELKRFPADIQTLVPGWLGGQKISPHHPDHRKTLLGADVHDPKGSLKPLCRKSWCCPFGPIQCRNHRTKDTVVQQLVWVIVI